MTTYETHAHGTYSWADLATTDLTKAKDFYGKLFGWTFDDMRVDATMTYSMCKVGGREVAAVYNAPKGVPLAWQNFVTVQSVDEVAKRVSAAGGKLVREPMDVMDAGRTAVIQDPTGAVLALWQAKRHVGARMMNEPGGLTWLELYTNQTDIAKKFYVEVLGWKTAESDMGPLGTYTLFSSDGSKDNGIGGMMQMPPGMKGMPPHWLAYFTVSKCDESAKKVASLGGKVVKEPADIPNLGRFAICVDPQGATFAIFEMKP